MRDWNYALDGVVDRKAKALVQQKREEMMADWDAPATYDDPLGGMSAAELENIQALLDTYAIKVRRKVENEVAKQWATHVKGVLNFE